MTEHMADTVEEIVKAAGGVLVNYRRGQLDAMGSAIHEHGTCRMGADPKRSALNAFNQMHEVEERVRRRRLGVPERVGEEPDADDPGAVVARDRLPGGGDQTWQPLNRRSVGRRQAMHAGEPAPSARPRPSMWVESLSALARQQAHAHAAAGGDRRAGLDARVLTARQNEVVVALTELIIPETDTPGAKAARVNRFVDAVLHDAPPADRETFLRGLAWIDARSRALFKKDFLAATAAEQTALLTTLSSDRNQAAEDAIGVEFFQAIKSMTINGYYTSEIGLRQELGDNGQLFLLQFAGCDHPDHQG